MSTPGLNPASPLKLQFPQSLAVYDDYAKAQKSVDFLADADFPWYYLPGNHEMAQWTARKVLKAEARMSTR